MFFFFIREFSLTSSRNKEAISLIPTSEATELVLVYAIQMENGQSSALLPGMYGKTLNNSSIKEYVLHLIVK